MEKIFKYTLDVLDTQVIEMPAQAQILSVQSQNGKGQIWVKVNPLNEPVKRTFNTFGTGHELTGDTCCHVGSYQLSNGGLVFHIFEAHANTH